MSTAQNTPNASDHWRNFQGGSCSYNLDKREKAIARCRKDGVVKGAYSDIELSPETDRFSNLYPTFDHIDCDGNDSEMVVEAALINRLKTNLSAKDFWPVIRHLYWTGIAKKKITAGRKNSLLSPQEWKEIDNRCRNAPAKFKPFIDYLRDEIKSRSGDINRSISDTWTEQIIDKLFSEQPALRSCLVDLLLAGGEQRVSELLEKIEQNRSEIEKAKDRSTEGDGQPPATVPEK
jgi:hypothetical protein